MQGKITTIEANFVALQSIVERTATAQSSQPLQEEFEAFKTEMTASKAELKDRITGLETEIESLKEKTPAEEPTKQESPAEAPVEATQKAESTETVERLESLEKKTKGGFAKVKDDFKKVNESIQNSITFLEPKVAQNTAMIESL